MTRIQTWVAVAAVGLATAIVIQESPSKAAVTMLTNGDGMMFAVGTSSTGSTLYNPYYGSGAIFSAYYSTSSVYGSYLAPYTGAPYFGTYVFYPLFGSSVWPMYSGAYNTAVQVNGVVGWTPYLGNGAATTEASGREIVLPVQTIGGLNVRKKVYVPKRRSWVRHLVILRNPTGGDLTADIAVYGDRDIFGGRNSSPGSVWATSGGGGIGTNAGPMPGIDRWVVTTQNFCCQAHQFHNIDGPGGKEQLDGISFRQANSNADWAWHNVTVPAGKRVILAYFVGGHSTIHDALASARRIDRTPSALTEKMGRKEIKDVVNWDLPLPPEEVSGSSSDCTAVSASMAGNQAGANGLAAILPLAGYLALRRRRRR